MSTDRPPVISQYYQYMGVINRRLVDGWYYDKGVYLQTIDTRVPLVSDDTVEEMREFYPRLFPFVRSLYRDTMVTDAHVGTLLYYSRLCQWEGHAKGSHYLSPDSVFSWAVTMNTDLWDTLNQVYEHGKYAFTRCFPPVTPEAVVISYGEDEDEEDEDD